MALPPARVTVQVAVQSPSRLLRDSLSTCLDGRPDVTVVGTVAEPDRMPALCELRRPDVAIFDAGLRLREICRPVDRLMRRFPELNVIVTYRDAAEEDIAAACQAGRLARARVAWAGGRAGTAAATAGASRPPDAGRHDRPRAGDPHAGWLGA